MQTLHHKIHQSIADNTYDRQTTYMPIRMNKTTTNSFKQEDQNSSSAYPSVPKRHIITAKRCN